MKSDTVTTIIDNTIDRKLKEGETEGVTPSTDQGDTTGGAAP